MHTSTAQTAGSAFGSARPRGSRYQPPHQSAEITLSDLLARAPRRSAEAQRDLLEEGGTLLPPVADLRLYYAGDLELLNHPSVAIVGAREVSEAGVLRTQRLTRELVNAGVTIVSGLARGVDSTAHKTAIDCRGRTVAVIGTPLDKAYPAENAGLQETIYTQHLLVSQFQNGTRTFQSSFPQRNRLMATLSDATVVVEASDTSGSLHQAAECTKLGRWLFIAKSVVDDPKLTWPKKFLKYPTCVTLESVTDITSRIGA